MQILMSVECRPLESFSANGVSGRIASNPTDWLGLVGELIGYALAWQNHSVCSGPSGPHLARRWNYRWFAERIRDDCQRGIDVGVARHIAIRPLQAEYFLTTAPDGNNDEQNNFRYSAGVVLRLGGK